MITGIAASVTVIIAAIFVCLHIFGVIRIPGTNGDKDQTAAVDDIEVETIEAEAETENGTGAESENDEDSDSEDDDEEDGSFDREEWLASPPVVKGLYVTGPVAGSS